MSKKETDFLWQRLKEAIDNVNYCGDCDTFDMAVNDEYRCPITLRDIDSHSIGCCVFIAKNKQRSR